MEWDPELRRRFLGLAGRIPLFHRQAARTMLERAAEEHARLRKAGRVETQDLVGAVVNQRTLPLYGLFLHLLTEAGLGPQPQSSAT